MRARYPDAEGYAEHDGVKIAYEVFGSGPKTVLLLPTWAMVHSRCWKFQVPYLSRYARVVTFDPRGNGRSDRPTDPGVHVPAAQAGDALAVMDAVGVERASVVAHSLGVGPALVLAAENPERVERLAVIAPFWPLGEDAIDPGGFLQEIDAPEGWEKFNEPHWRRDFDDFREYFFASSFSEPHSTKAIDDAWEWSEGMTPEILTSTIFGAFPGLIIEDARQRANSMRCPVLVIHGTDDRVAPASKGETLAAETGGTLVLLEGSGHDPHARDPVKVNLLLRDFFGLRPPPGTWTRGTHRRRRALYISSPIGLGHALRDVAIADELRKLHPDLEVDWLAQEPVTRVLAERGERIHPASEALASEVAHIDSESGEHDLHAFQAIRRMDEILLANFMVFHDLVEEEDYDLWIGDEAWDLDHYLHENPEQKRAPFVWLTDFVGWLPMPDGGARESFLTADYNAEMIEHIARYPRLRDRSIFVGNPEDVVPDTFGPDLPAIREWTEQHFAFSGYVTGFDPAELADRERLRAELGYGQEEKVCMVTVGGSGVGAPLLRRVIESFPEAKRSTPELRMVVVTGPRIDPGSLPTREGLDLRPYVSGLYRHLAACDIALVQGGLSTCMELAANRRPFLYFPLKHHFEQQLHIPHRLERYGAGRRMDFDTSSPETIAAAITEEVGREVSSRPVEGDGAARAAALLLELLP
ncbi:MAG TPA: alpha/beta fold hydrolase [Actinomycetota bacterium]|nr:alpha/beta fold hydrolase [Actinomycetota bacterium]